MKAVWQNEVRGEIRLGLHKMILKQALINGRECWVLCLRDKKRM
jgi:hypothetical protein